MAGAFTHLMLCHELMRDIKYPEKERKYSFDGELLSLLNTYENRVYLGSVSPDIPYLSVVQPFWADAFHYEKTNAIPIYVHAHLRNKWKENHDYHRAVFAWLCGYVSHLVADATIHPIVEAIVGPYQENKIEHRLCELTQDSLVFYEIMNQELVEAEFTDHLRKCRDEEFFYHIKMTWKTACERVYPEKGIPLIASWIDTYIEAIDSAETDDLLPALFRHAVSDTEFYKPKWELEEQFPDDVRKYYTNAKLPGNLHGHFLEFGFYPAAENIAIAWKRMYKSLFDQERINTVVKNWNLDTGVDMDNNEVTYWKRSDLA